jgi:virginiamycin A acetyltransferase
MLTNILRFLKTLVSSSDVRWDNLKDFLSSDSNVDKDTKINSPAKLVSVSVGKGTYIAYNATITNTIIGKFCSIGPNLLCGWGIHPLNGISTSPVFYSTKKQAGFTLSKTDKIEERRSIKIGNDVFIGANVVILDGVNIGDGAVIGAGAVVTKDIPPYAIAAGIPAQVVKYRFEEDVIQKLQKSRWWDGDDAELRRVEAMFFDVEGFLGSAKNVDL